MSLVREVLAPVRSAARAFLVGAAHAGVVLIASLAFWAWLYEMVL